jgi:CRP/FNR family cyclic AMP-dependent transcriptional regulator
MADVQDVLAQVPIFSMLKPKELKSLTADAHDLTYPAGTTLADTDELGSTFFVVVEGTLHVLVDGKQVRSIGPGDFFGEMALIDHEPRSATIVTDTDVRCLVFSSWVFRPFALKHPEVAWALLELMVARIREAEKR